MKINEDILASETDGKMNGFQVNDALGNPLKIGDIVLVLVPKTDASFRKAVVRDLKVDYFERRTVYVEYDDGRLYCNLKHFEIKKDSDIKFTSKPIKVWRYNEEVIKFDNKYFD